MNTINWIVATAVLMTLSPVAGAADARVFFHTSSVTPQHDETFELHVFVNDGDFDVLSYALRLTYDPAVIEIVEISAGKDPVYGTPLSNTKSFTKGQTDFTANKAITGATPESYQIARVVFHVVGESGTKSPVRIAAIPQGGLVAGKRFNFIDTEMPFGVKVSVE
ncbi:MAG: hypothetical protein HKN70_13275 [Gammaproteobacteria bacterium]|nr:hypothetical protein [Gammaproteobacteria bacterium]